MNQVKWTFVGIPGRPYEVGLYHSPTKGHLLIYSNNKIVLIRFGVKDDSFFSFFIEEELIEIHITKNQQGDFEYEFRINKDVDTVYNQQRKADIRANNIKLAVIVGAITLIIVAVVAGGFFYTKNFHSRMLATEGTWVEAVAVVTEVQRSRDYFSLVYSYNHRNYHSKPIYFTYPHFTSEGFVLHHGDPYQIKIAHSRPDINDRDSFRMSANNPTNFIEKAAIGLMESNPGFSEAFALCVAEKVYESAGASGLAVLASIPYADARGNPFSEGEVLDFLQDRQVMTAIRECR